MNVADLLRNSAWPRLAAGTVLALIGLAMVVAGEWQRATAVRILDLAGGTIVEVDAGSDLFALEGRLVHVTGKLGISRPARDRLFGVEADTPQLNRVVSMQQWHEVTGLAGDITYVRDWYDHPIDSSQFAQRERHRNPPFPIHRARFAGGQPSVEGLLLDAALVQAIPGKVAVEPRRYTLPANLAATFHIQGDTLISSRHPGSPQIGDLRISWEKQPLREVSIVAKVHNHVLMPSTSLLAPGFVLMVGQIPLDIMLPGRSLMLPRWTWVWRILGLLLAVVGVGLVLASVLTRGATMPLASAAAMLVVAVPAGAVWAGVRAWPWMLWWLLALVAAAVLVWLWRRHVHDAGV